MLKKVKLDRVQIPDGHLLSAKADLNLTYHQTRGLKRWLKDQGVAMKSEKTTRRIANPLLQPHAVTGELLPLTTKDNEGCRTVKLLPSAAVQSMAVTVEDNIMRNAEAGNLTWHQGLIPQDELWIKILGDHGGGTFKMAFQILNVGNPNSKTNTVVFSLFSAKDTRENLRTATSRFATEIGELRGKQWRLPDGCEMHSHVFAAGDYAQLSMWYGISGAAGHELNADDDTETYPCLYFEVRKECLNLEADDDDMFLVIPNRSLDRMSIQHRNFMQNGRGNVKYAKHFKNVIAPAMFNIPLNQVCIPGLHLSLGIFHKLYSMMEKALNDLDRTIASHLVRDVLQDEDVDEAEVLHRHHLHGLTPYVEAVEEAGLIVDRVENITAEINSLENDLAWAFLQSDDAEDVIDLKEEAERFRTTHIFVQLRRLSDDSSASYLIPHGKKMNKRQCFLVLLSVVLVWLVIAMFRSGHASPTDILPGRLLKIGAKTSWISNKKVNDGDIGTQDNVTNGSMELNMTPVEMKKDVQKRKKHPYYKYVPNEADAREKFLTDQKVVQSVPTEVPEWVYNKTAGDLFRKGLIHDVDLQNGNFLTTQENTPVNSTITRYTGGAPLLKVSTDVFKSFPKESPFKSSYFNTCSVVGNGGILKESGCGKEIDASEFIIRCNMAPMDDNYLEDIGKKTSLITFNADMISYRYDSLKKPGSVEAFLRDLSAYGDSYLWIPAFFSKSYANWALLSERVIRESDATAEVIFPHVDFIKSVHSYWRRQGLKAASTTGTHRKHLIFIFIFSL
ncbi:ST8SIA1 [Branchiostoma lanceolatum]|uniref:ST8SIA1 protein n=1 Tax=Branchiostoma lanceolatum TaxID=7740 RepID=A0A8S4MMH0_BRALA|nr:ST8SIA1 [Branchiostoma lanceolatum]